MDGPCAHQIASKKNIYNGKLRPDNMQPSNFLAIAGFRTVYRCHCHQSMMITVAMKCMKWKPFSFFLFFCDDDQAEKSLT